MHQNTTDCNSTLHTISPYKPTQLKLPRPFSLKLHLCISHTLRIQFTLHLSSFLQLGVTTIMTYFANCKLWKYSRRNFLYPQDTCALFGLCSCHMWETKFHTQRQEHNNTISSVFTFSGSRRGSAVNGTYSIQVAEGVLQWMVPTAYR
jgi:hypothetical protein